MKRVIVALVMVMNISLMIACGVPEGNQGQKEHTQETTEITTEVTTEAAEAESIHTEEAVNEEEFETVYLVSRIKNKVWLTDGESIAIIEYDYDERGNLVLRETKDGEGALTYRSSFEYDEGDKLLREISEGSTLEYEYNDAGEKEKAIRKNNDGTVIGEILYEYDEKNKLTIENYYGRSEALEESRAYDENGILRKSTFYMENEEAGFVDEYNEKGDLIKSITNDFQGSFWEQVYDNEYDENGNLVKVNVMSKVANDSDKVEEEIIYYEYDENGNRVKEVVDDVIRTEYEYDENGNKIKETMYESEGKINFQSELEYISMEIPKKK